jgi:hypothetical protein
MSFVNEENRNKREEISSKLSSRFNLHVIIRASANVAGKQKLQNYGNDWKFFQCHPPNLHKKGRYVLFFGSNPTEKRIEMIELGSHDKTTGG